MCQRHTFLAKNALPLAIANQPTLLTDLHDSYLLLPHEFFNRLYFTLCAAAPGMAAPVLASWAGWVQSGPFLSAVNLVFFSHARPFSIVSKKQCKTKIHSWISNFLASILQLLLTDFIIKALFANLLIIRRT